MRRRPASDRALAAAAERRTSSRPSTSVSVIPFPVTRRARSRRDTGRLAVTRRVGCRLLGGMASFIPSYECMGNARGGQGRRPERGGEAWVQPGSSRTRLLLGSSLAVAQSDSQRGGTSGAIGPGTLSALLQEIAAVPEGARGDAKLLPVRRARPVSGAAAARAAPRV